MKKLYFLSCILSVTYISSAKSEKQDLKSFIESFYESDTNKFANEVKEFEKYVSIVKKFNKEIIY